MRLPNFLSTASSRAALSITQTLYDRRALDCTSSRPLVQSLHELMVLTSTSVRVRETLCQDGGLERLVQILIEAQDESDPLAPYKWHLSMQCLLNLSARGSLEMRTRIVEAGVIPVVASVLDNYLVAHNERRANHQPQTAISVDSRVFSDATTVTTAFSSTSSSVTVSANSSSTHLNDLPSEYIDSTDSTMQVDEPDTSAPTLTQISSSQASSTPSSSSNADETDNSDLNAIVSALPYPISYDRFRQFLAESSAAEQIISDGPPSVRNTPLSTDALLPAPQGVAIRTPEPADRLEPGQTPLPVRIPTLPSHRGSDRSPLATDGMPKFQDGKLVLLEQDVYVALEVIAFVSKHSMLRRRMQDTSYIPQISVRPEKEITQKPDGVATFKQNLAGLSPQDWELAYYNYDFGNIVDMRPEFYARRFNLFELVEKFTAFSTPKHFPYWACLIMRNFVRKDDGGVRQCANFQCGKWEEHPRQFAKCRRCKRTKYCSKACQLKAWSMHRYWCALSHPSPSQSASTSNQSSQETGDERRVNENQRHSHTHTHNHSHSHSHSHPHSSHDLAANYIDQSSQSSLNLQHSNQSQSSLELPNSVEIEMQDRPDIDPAPAAEISGMQNSVQSTQSTQLRQAQLTQLTQPEMTNTPRNTVFGAASSLGASQFADTVSQPQAALESTAAPAAFAVSTSDTALGMQAAPISSVNDLYDPRHIRTGQQSRQNMPAHRGTAGLASRDAAVLF